MSSDPIVIASYARTPMGGFQGVAGLGQGDRSGRRRGEGCGGSAPASRGDAVERIYMGCVLPAGLGQAPARQAGSRRSAALGASNHRQQDVRLGHAGRDHGV